MIPVRSFLLLIFFSLFYAGCKSRPEGEVAINKVSLKNIDYHLSSYYSAQDSIISVTLYMECRYHDTARLVKINEKDTILLSGIPMTFNGRGYVADIPARTQQLDFYLKLKDTLCFNVSYALPHINYFSFDIHSDDQFQEFHINYRPSLEGKEKIKLEIPDSQHPVYDTHPSGHSNKSSIYPYQKDSTDLIKISREYVNPKRPNGDVALRLIKILEGKTWNQSLMLRYTFEVTVRNEQVWRTMNERNMYSH